jgi:site-specific recombinase XerD
MPPKIRKKTTSFPEAIRSFVGYLEGTQKSIHTIKNYQLDILAFQDFIYQEYSKKIISPLDIMPEDIARYRQNLQKKGFKTNTRRRKILTVSQFLGYLSKRNKVPLELAKKIPAPHKIERIPFTVPAEKLLDQIKNLPVSTPIQARNRVLLWTLAETGCLVSEVTEFRFDQWIAAQLGESGHSHPRLQIFGKFPRSIPVSTELLQAVQDLRPSQSQDPWLFQGFNKFGSLGGPISARGVELLVKSYAPQLGYPGLTPRTFRHSVIIYWFAAGMSQKEVQTRLGLRTTYAFRSYATLI